MDNTTTFTCYICGQECVGYGNDPWPFTDEADWESRCCDHCNETVVIPERIAMLGQPPYRV